MDIPAPDSIYCKDRSYFLDLLHAQIMQLRSKPGLRFQVAEKLRELSLMTPGCIEASDIVGDTVFHRTCCALQPIFYTAIATLLGNISPVCVLRVADELEAAVPLEIQNPWSHPDTW
ncbi:hypothetical protein CBS147311_6441 [Penicillium roqueforti]|nr:hypothetical protein CBS147311_6441 [Penicillium roqueforti]